jgi:hypothetical protein
MSQNKYRNDEVREIDILVQQIMDFLPSGSRKYCNMFSVPNHTLGPTTDPNLTFDGLTNSLTMFESDDIKNWQILANSV